MIESEYLLAGITGLIVIGNLLVVVGVVLVLGENKRPVSEDSAGEVVGLRQELRAISGAMTSFSELLDRFYDASERGVQPETAAVGGEDSGRKALEVAARLAGTGVSVVDLVNLCGVSEGEAELIRVLSEEQEKSAAVG